MKCQSPRLSARGRDDVDIGILVVGAGEGDLRAVRGENRIGQEVHAARQHVRFTAAARHAPELAAVLEDDLRARHRRMSQQDPVQRRRPGSGKARQSEYRCQPFQHDGLLH